MACESRVQASVRIAPLTHGFCIPQVELRSGHRVCIISGPDILRDIIDIAERPHLSSASTMVS
jgi:hypothetical protein